MQQQQQIEQQQQSPPGLCCAELQQQLLTEQACVNPAHALVTRTRLPRTLAVPPLARAHASCRYVRTLSRAVAMNGSVSLIEENESLRAKLKTTEELQLQHDQVSSRSHDA
jgi:hypothetical protein